jgi:hypothetical protein
MAFSFHRMSAGTTSTSSVKKCEKIYLSSSAASGRCVDMETTGTSGFIMPAFSRAIFSIVFPSIFTWSTAFWLQRWVRSTIFQENQARMYVFTHGGREGLSQSKRVIPQTTGDGSALVASSLPPNPTSMTAASTFSLVKM